MLAPGGHEVATSNPNSGEGPAASIERKGMTAFRQTIADRTNSGFSSYASVYLFGIVCVYVVIVIMFFVF